jgi:hypothetical protein
MQEPVVRIFRNSAATLGIAPILRYLRHGLVKF